jgi:hypothetical protein
MPVQYGGDKITFSDGSTVGNGWSGFKNRIINGAMMIDQRNAGASVTPTDATYNLDRWKAHTTQSSKFTVQQNAGSVTPPVGFTKYLGITSSSAYSLTSSDYFAIVQNIEGFNCADLEWGTASASTVNLSFWVRSSLTGTFGGSFINSGYSRSYPFTYTISSANTWEQKTVTIAGDTTGSWNKDNTVGIRIWFGIGVGSESNGTAGAWSATGNLGATGATSVVGTNGATFYITGVQLEKGSTATSFDYRPYGTELLLCQRYYQVGNIACYGFSSGSTKLISTQYLVQTRAVPTVTVTTRSATIGADWNADTYNTNYIDFANGSSGEQRQRIAFTLSSEL